jgi:hypothetical protein
VRFIARIVGDLKVLLLLLLLLLLGSTSIAAGTLFRSTSPLSIPAVKQQQKQQNMNTLPVVRVGHLAEICRSTQQQHNSILHWSASHTRCVPVLQTVCLHQLNFQ